MEHILKGRNDSAIEEVAQGLTPMEAKDYLPELRDAALRNSTPHPRLQTLGAIAGAGTDKAARVLAELANQGTEPTVGVALGLLSEMPPAVAMPEWIKELLAGTSPHVREATAFALASKRARQAIPALRSALKDPNEKVLFAAELGLARFGISGGVKELNATAGGHDKDLSLIAIVGLASLEEPKGVNELKELVKTSDGANKGSVVWAIASFGATGLKPLTYELGLDRNPVFVSMLAEKIYNPNDKRDLSVMRSALGRHDDIPGLVVASKLLGTSADKDAEADLRRGLSSMSKPVRDFAVHVATSNPRFWPSLADLLNDPDPSTKEAALDAIKNLHETEKFDEAAQCFSNPNTVGSVSLAAAKTMASLDPKRALEYFSERLSSATGHVRMLSAAMVLIIRGEPSQTAAAQ
ncbi:MAG: HEAT repeat domain-containing protein [Bryobacteraceae bacterium]